MKDKLFSKLKQEYSSLGLGDVILLAHAENLANLGFVTDDNIDKVIASQKGFLEGLQRDTDKRVTDAQQKLRDKLKKEQEEERLKKEEEAKKKAEEEAKRKAEEEATKKRKAEEEAKKKAEEEAEAKRLEELRKNTDIPDWFKKDQEERAERAKKQEEAYQQMIAKIQEDSLNSANAFKDVIAKLQEQNNTLLEGYNNIKQENERAKAEAKQRQHDEFVLSEAKRLGIPQYRIDEGFTLANDAPENEITEYLSKVSTNIKANSVPLRGGYQLADDKPTKEEIDELASMLVKK